MEQRLKKLLEQAHSAVFFGGAGVSCESGIPDFRSQDGLYHQQWPWPPEEISPENTPGADSESAVAISPPCGDRTVARVRSPSAEAPSGRA